MAVEASARTTGGPRLEWDGKRTQVDRIQLPFQVIETVNEPREKDLFSAAAAREALATGWRNKLIWGDNKLVCASLLKEFEGKIDLIYIDPPFDTGTDFSFRVSIGDQEIEKQPSIIETKAYYDTWGGGAASYLQMMYERLALIRELLSSRGTLYVHVGGDVTSYVRVLMDEIFGRDGLVNEIVWKRQTAHSDIGQGARHLGRLHDTLLLYTKGDGFAWNMQYQGYSEDHVRNFYRYQDADGRRYRLSDITGPGGQAKGNHWYEFLGVTRYWRFSRERMQELYDQGRIVQTRPGAVPAQKRYLDEMPGVPLQDIWDDTPPVQAQANERLGYDTQKPEVLLDRIIRLSSNEGGLVADFFCGSGTTLAVAEKLGRRWIGADLGRFAVHTTRKRLLDIPNCKPFEVLNLGKYERQYWQGVTTGRDDRAYMRLILQLYRAEPLDEGTMIHGLKAGIAVHVGPIDSVVTIEEAMAAAEGARELGYKRLHILGWDWQMGLKETAVDHAIAIGVQLSLKRIPSEIMDPRAREKGDVEFFEMNHVDATADVRSRSVQVFLEDFIVADLELVKPEIQERIEKFSDYIDYWAVDFDYRDDTFHNQWQSFRTRKQPKLELESAVHTYDSPGERDVLVKVIDIFGNDTTKLLKIHIQ